MTSTSEGVTVKRNAGRGATRAMKGAIAVLTRGRYGYDFSITYKPEDAPPRTLYINRADAYDLADALDTVLAETEPNDD